MAGDEVIARLDDARDRQIVGLRAPAGKDDFASAATQKAGHLLPRALHGSPRPLAVKMNRRCIAKVLTKKRPHGRQHLGQKRGGGIVIEIDAAHHNLNFV